MRPIQGLSIALRTLTGGTHCIRPAGPRVGERLAAFTPPYSPEEWQLIA